MVPANVFSADDIDDNPVAAMPAINKPATPGSFLPIWTTW